MGLISRVSSRTYRDTMKIKRNKKASKLVKLLTQHLGYRPPLQIIADGTFVKAATDNELAKNYDPKTSQEQDPLVVAMHKYLDVSFNIFTTISVMNELSMLGPEFRKAARLAKQYKLFPTEFSDLPREKLPPARTCIAKMIKKSKEGAHFVIATNDPKLRHNCRIDGIPYIYIHKNSLILEGVKVEGGEGSRTTLQTAEIEGVKKLKEEMVKKGVLEGQVKNVYSHKKKKQKKGANPLSMKKGKKSVGKNKDEPKLGKSRGAKRRRAKKLGDNGKSAENTVKTE